MIAVVLEGGLGNQMFQYAAGRSVAAARGVGLLLSVGELQSTRRGRTPRAYELGGYRISAALCSPAQERELALARRLRALSGLMTRWQVLAERGPKFDARLFKAPSGSVLRGYWQSPRYFGHDAPLLAAELTLVEPLPSAHRAWAEQMASPHSVAVHIRRGDYVASASAARFHGALPLDYYQRAIDSIRRFEAAPVCYVFTDDPAWCRANLVLPGCEVHHVSATLASTGPLDLALMRCCRHYVIANSSFSWWGAWLGGVDAAGAGRVVAPRLWFAGDVRSTHLAERFPPHWELI